MFNSLRKVDFFAPYWPLYMEKTIRAPLEKILDAPLKTRALIKIAMKKCEQHLPSRTHLHAYYRKWPLK